MTKLAPVRETTDLHFMECPLCAKMPHAAYHNEFPAIVCSECDLVLVSRISETWPQLALRWNSRRSKVIKSDNPNRVCGILGHARGCGCTLRADLMSAEPSCIGRWGSTHG